MKELVDGYVKHLLSEKVDYDRTIRKYLMCINEFQKYMNIETIEDIDKLSWIDIKDDWINIKRDELSASSVNLRIAAIRSFLNYLVGKRYIKENVAERIKKEKCKSKNVKINEEEVRKVLKCVDDEYNKNKNYLTIRNKFIINILIFTGLRNEELRDLKINDINFRTGEFMTNGKFSKERELCIPKEIMTLYEEYLSYRNTINTTENYMFLSKNGKYLDKNAVTNIVKKISELSGVTNFVAHDMRHICGSLLIDSGVSIEDVSKILGHSSVMITSKVYCNQVEGSSKNIINKNKLLENII